MGGRVRGAAIALSVMLAAGPAVDLPSALAGIVAAQRNAARVLICGSLYLAGHVLRSNA